MWTSKLQLSSPLEFRYETQYHMLLIETRLCAQMCAFFLCFLSLCLFFKKSCVCVYVAFNLFISVIKRIKIKFKVCGETEILYHLCCSMHGYWHEAVAALQPGKSLWSAEAVVHRLPGCSWQLGNHAPSWKPWPLFPAGKIWIINIFDSRNAHIQMIYWVDFWSHITESITVV